MRTTISLDVHLLAQLKKRAADSGTSVSRLVEQAVHLMICGATASKRQDSFELVTFGRGGRFSRQNIDKTSTLVESEEIVDFQFWDTRGCASASVR